MSCKAWFITGTSRGLGREWAIAALERGDHVAATARDTSTLHDLVDRFGERLLPIQLDVTDRAADFAAVAAAHAHFGRLDVIVNNAGYVLFGMVEELSEHDLRSQMETNFFGAVWITQAALPLLREQASGHILQVSSIAGITAFPNTSGYHATKWALEGFTQSLASEVAAFGIKVTLIEPFTFSTDYAASATHSTPIPAYDGIRTDAADQRRARQIRPRGRPETTRADILALVDAEDPPLRIFFGADALAIATAEYEARLSVWRDWQAMSIGMQDGPAAQSTVNEYAEPHGR